ncbi:MAG: LemA family protein [Halospina sp.]
MDSRQLIERMLAEGRISPDQAEQLRAGMDTGSARATSSPPRRRNPATLMVFIAVLVAVLVFAGLLWGQGGGEPPPVQDVGEWMSEQDETGDRTAMLSRNLALALFILVPLALVTLVLGWSYNSLISKEEAVFSQWAQLESNYQRRQDLIPQLVDSVSRYLEHERETMEEVVEGRGQGGDGLSQAMDELIAARADAAETTAETGNGPPEDEAELERIARVQARLSEKSSRLMAVVEDYPELRSADQFMNLQAQLEGTENRINVARMRFNEAVQAYNSTIRRVPGNLVAGMGEFSRKAYFEADEGAADAGSLDFR